MLTGKPAFDGDDVADTLANILKSEPDWSGLPADDAISHPASAAAMSREGSAGVALHDIADARLDLEEKDPASSHAGSAGRDF